MMRIRFLRSPVEDVIAWEEQFGEREGHFVALPTGSVVYRHPADTRDWCAGLTPKLFQEAAQLWNRYIDEVAVLPELEQTAAVVRLRAGLENLGVLTDEPDAIWPVLLEQAEAGSL